MTQKEKALADQASAQETNHDDDAQSLAGSAGVRAPDRLSILRHNTLKLTKIWLRNGSIKGYDDPKNFKLDAVEVRDITELSALLTRLETDAHSCLIRGTYVGEDVARDRTPKADFRPGYVLRRKALFDDQPLHSVLIEIDDFEPLAVDPVAEPAIAIEEYITTNLPEAFQAVSFHWQLSSSAGHPTKAGLLKAHVWFWLTTARTSAELKAWATAIGLEADLAVFDPIQIHYTSAPAMEAGVADPVLVRSGFVSGLCGDAVDLEIAPAVLEPAANGGRKLRDTRQNGNVRDDLAEFLFDHWEVRGETSDGLGIHVRCPWEDEHTVDTGPSSTTYFRKGTAGYEQGHFVCQHMHCRGVRTDGDFEHAVGYVAHDFEDVAAQAAAENRAGIDAARREYQRKQNAEIGDGSSFVPTAEVVTLDQALARFVFLADGSRVADILNPHYDLAFPDWAATFAASKVKVEQPEQQLADGSTKRKAPKPVAVSDLWRAHPRRKTAICRTFKAGADLIVLDPDGKRAVNMWRPFDRSLVIDDPAAAGVGLFLDHVAYLIPDPEAAGRFLDWLAHIEQCPGVLPHTAWLHIAPKVGMGRNWMASVLTRVWAGSVAANFRLSDTLKSGFNGGLSRKVLAIVDEIREGGRESQWDHSQSMKEMITAERRTINPKFGRQSVEFNACRFLLFSNHISAIPIEKDDRRFEVVINDAAPKDADYYIRLYAAISNPRFIAAVATYLAQRDIRHFNPGARAVASDAKLEVINSNRTPMAEWADRMVSHWPADVIPSGIARDIVSGDEFARSTSAAVRRALEDAGVSALGKPVKIGKEPVRLSILRNKARWLQASTDELRVELAKASRMTDPRAELEQIEAESGGERAR